jgi:hypothetical protein
MEEYDINLTKSTIEGKIHWSGSVMKKAKPKPGQNTVSTSESIAREIRSLAEDDIISKSAKIDFAIDKVQFISTGEQVTSINELKEKLKDVED